MCFILPLIFQIQDFFYSLLRSVAYSYSGGQVERPQVRVRPLSWTGHCLLFFLRPDATQTQAETGRWHREDDDLCRNMVLWFEPLFLFLSHSQPHLSVQVSDLGCQAFAILFDDIDHSMCQADSEAFSSFAHAQVTVTNEIYRFLGEPPVFLFCPTGKECRSEQLSDSTCRFYCCCWRMTMKYTTVSLSL